MQKEQKTYTKEFKVEAVRLLQSSQKSQAQIARELGVADSTLSQWRKDLAEHGHDAFPGSGHQTPLEEENRHLKREVEILRQERDILKKLSASFRASQREVCVHCGASGRVPGDADVQGA
jgi:transposase